MTVPEKNDQKRRPGSTKEADEMSEVEITSAEEISPYRTEELPVIREKAAKNLAMGLVPIEIGTHVKIIASEDRNTIGKDTFIGRIGEVVGIVEDDWKYMMIQHRCYPKCILHEKMYQVEIKEEKPWSISVYAFRYTELLPVANTKENED